MLTGLYSYKGHNYNISAYDFGDSISVFMSPHTSEDKKFLDAGIKLPESSTGAMWDNSLYVSVGTGYVYASKYVLTEVNEETGEEVKGVNILNAPVIQKFGSILVGMRTSCNKNTKASDGLYEEFNPSKEAKYIFDRGYMCLDLRIIKEVLYENKVEDVYLKLEEDYTYDVKIYKPTSTNHKFPLDLSEFIPEKVDNDWDFETDDTIFNLQEIIEANPNKSYVWLKERRYEIVKDLKRVEEVCMSIWLHDGIVAFDTETTGLNVNVTSRQGQGDVLVGMVFSIKPGEAYYFPVKHKKIENICTEANEAYIINKYFKPILEEKRILCHNGSFDWKVMYNYGIFTNVVEDTLILFKVSFWNDHRDLGLGLKNLTNIFLNRDSFELSDFVKGKFDSKNVKFWDLEEESVKYYACPDTDNLLELFDYCQKSNMLSNYGAKKVYQVEVAFSLVIAYQEYYGHCVDMSRIDDLVKDITNTKETEYKAMVEMVGHDFNPRSNKDLPQVVFTELGYPIIEYTATGNPSCGKRTRGSLLQEKNPDGSLKYPFIKHLDDYLNACTLESNFTKNISKFATEDGLMFSQVQQFLETGRVSVSDPNYQSYSDVVKKYIIPRSGYYALDADYSSVEARIMVSMAGCKDMVEAMKDPDMDYHTLKASQMFNIPYEMVTKKQRKMAKGVNFGLLYGLGDRNLSKNLFGDSTPEDIIRARHQKELYFTGMEELRGFIEKSRAQGIQQNYSTTNIGRRRYYDPRKTRQDTIERQSCNARIQGTAADIYKEAMVRLLFEIRKNNWMGQVLISAFVHDECFLEVSKALDPIKVLKVLRGCMMLEQEGWCPLYIGCGFGRTWYEAKNTEIPIQVQESLINEYGETGLPWWSGNNDELCDFIVKSINEYGRDRVIGYLKDENNWGKVLNPAVNSLAHDVIGAIKKGDEIEGCVTKDIEEKPDTIENLYEFAKAFDCVDLVEKADVREAVHVEEKTEDYVNTLNKSDDEEVFDWKDQMLMMVNRTGYYIKASDRTMYIKLPADKMQYCSLMDRIKNSYKDSEKNAFIKFVKGSKISKNTFEVNKRLFNDMVTVIGMLK